MIEIIDESVVNGVEYVVYKHKNSICKTTVKGIVFLLKEVTIGSSTISYYQDVLLDPIFKDKIKRGVETGEVDKNWYNYLVRRGVKGNYYYYPLWLIFSDRETREIVAEENKTRVPCDRWVRRKIKVIKKELGLLT